MTIVQSALLPSANVSTDAVPSFWGLQAVGAKLTTLIAGFGGISLLLLWLYTVLLVAVAGRTVGMMVTDLRVVRATFQRPRALDVLRRYILAALSVVTVFPLILWGLRRVQPYERVSGTRLVSASATLVPSSERSFA